MDRFGTVDVLLNNASMRMRDVHPSAVLNVLDSTDEQWQYTFEVSIFGVLRTIRRFVRPMIENKSGSIINVWSGSGIIGRPGNQPYGAVKAALHNMTQSLSGELAEHNIAVNSSSPAAPAAPATRSRRGYRRRWDAYACATPSAPTTRPPLPSTWRSRTPPRSPARP